MIAHSACDHKLARAAYYIMKDGVKFIPEKVFGKNGPPVTLITSDKKANKFSGTLAEGTITEKELMGSLMGKSVKDLIKQIKKGNAYVNVHTDKYPDGEIRRQIK